MAMFGFNNNMFGNRRSLSPMPSRSAAAINPPAGVNSPNLGYPKKANRNPYPDLKYHGQEMPVGPSLDGPNLQTEGPKGIKDGFKFGKRFNMTQTLDEAQNAQRQPSDIRMNRPPFGMANLPRPTQSAGGRVLQGVVAGAQADPNIQPSYGSGINPNASPDLRSAAAVGQAMNSVERASQGARLATPQYRSPVPPPVNPAEVVPYGMGPQSRIPWSGMAGARNVLNGQAQDTNTAMRPLNIPGMVYDEANGRMIPQSQVPRASTADQANAGLGGMTPNQFRAAQEGEYDAPINETAGGILRRQQAAANSGVLDGKQYSPADWQVRAERQSLRRAFTGRGGRGRAGFNNFVNNYYNQNGGSSYFNDQFGPGDRQASQQAAYRILRPGAVDRFGRIGGIGAKGMSLPQNPNSFTRQQQQQAIMEEEVNPAPTTLAPATQDEFEFSPPTPGMSKKMPVQGFFRRPSYPGVRGNRIFPG